MPRSRRLARIAALAAAGAGVLWVVGGVSTSHWARRAGPGPAASDRASPPSAGPAPAAEAAPLEAALPEAVALPDAPFEEPVLDREEIARRRAIAARIRARIEEGPREAPPGTFGGLLGDAEPVPVYRDGELLGIELRDVAAGGFYERIGLAEGDLVQSINGVPLDAEGLAGQLLWSLTESSQLELEVERLDGRQQRVAVPRDQLLDELEALGEGE